MALRQGNQRRGCCSTIAVHAPPPSLQAQQANPCHASAPAQSVPFDAAPARSYAFALGGLAAQTLSVGLSSDSKEAQKNALKASGVTWLVAAMQLAYNAHEGKCGQDPGFVYRAAAGHVGLAALCLWRGFAEERRWERDLW